MGTHFFCITDADQPAPLAFRYEPPPEDSSTFVQFTTPLDSAYESFISNEADDGTAESLWVEQVNACTGMLVTPGFALIDTAAQHGTIGQDDYRQLCERLAVQGLKPRKVPTRPVRAVGVGGTTMPLQSARFPLESKVSPGW